MKKSRWIWGFLILGFGGFAAAVWSRNSSAPSSVSQSSGDEAALAPGSPSALSPRLSPSLKQVMGEAPAEMPTTPVDNLPEVLAEIPLDDRVMRSAIVGHAIERASGFQSRMEIIATEIESLNPEQGSEWDPDARDYITSLVDLSVQQGVDAGEFRRSLGALSARIADEDFRAQLIRDGEDFLAADRAPASRR